MDSGRENEFTPLVPDYDAFGDIGTILGSLHEKRLTFSGECCRKRQTRRTLMSCILAPAWLPDQPKSCRSLILKDPVSLPAPHAPHRP
jgi:hypothetical protein